MNKELFITLLEAGCLITLSTRHKELMYLVQVPVEDSFGTSYVTFEMFDIDPCFFNFKETLEAFAGRTPKGKIAKAKQLLQSFLGKTYTIY